MVNFVPLTLWLSNYQIKCYNYFEFKSKDRSALLKDNCEQSTLQLYIQKKVFKYVPNTILFIILLFLQNLEIISVIYGSFILYS